MKEMKNSETARRLREALAITNMSQQELSDRSGVPKASISQYVNGTHIPGNKKAGQLAEVLGVNPLWLMGFDVPRIDSDQNILEAYQAELIREFDGLSEDNKQLVRDLIKQLKNKE